MWLNFPNLSARVDSWCFFSSIFLQWHCFLFLLRARLVCLASQRDMALILLEKVHPAVLEAVRRIVSGECDVPSSTIRDFDGSEYIVALAEDAASLTVSIKFHDGLPSAFFDKHCKAQLPAILTRYLKSHKGCLEAAPLDEGAVATVRVPVNEEDPAKTVEHPALAVAAQMRHLCLFSAFEAWYERVEKNDAAFTQRVPYHQNESMYFYSERDVPACCICIRVVDADLQLFVNSFLETIQHTRKSVAGAPAVGFSRGKAPSMGKNTPVEPQDDASFWVTFSLSKRLLDPKVHESAVLQIINFRQTLFYHVSTTRSAMHAKMRARVESALVVLNRAKTKTTGQPKVEIQ